MHLIMNPDLFRDIKEEISKAEVTDSPTGQSLNYQKLASLPLLQSVYTETLRLHVGVLITRKSTESITLGEYTFPEGSVFQAPTAVSHLDESICMSDFIDYTPWTNANTLSLSSLQIKRRLTT